LGYAYLQTGRYGEGVKLFATLARYGKLDAYAYALLSVTQAQAGDQAASDEAIKEALLADDQDTGVLTAQAFLALKLNRNNSLVGFANRLANEKGQRTETWYYVTAVNNRLRRFQEARRAFERSVLAEPANADAYVERGTESLSIANASQLPDADKQYLYETAKAYFEVALAARPESAHALSGVALVALYQNKNQDAIAYGEAAVKAAPSSPIGHYVLAAAYAKQSSVLSKAAGGRLSPEVSRLGTLAAESNRRAGQLDVRSLQGRTIPKEEDVFKYLSEAGRNPVLSLPGR
jgi:predicted Zn-dependent protease